MKLKRMTFTTDLELPPPTIYWQFPSVIFPSYKLVWPFLWHWKVSGLKKGWLQRGHTNPTPKCTFCMWAQMVVWEVDGPSLQPSTWHLSTLFMPTAECKGVAYRQGSPPLKLEEQLERQTPVPDPQEQRLQVLWTPEGADGRQWWKGHDKHS